MSYTYRTAILGLCMGLSMPVLATEAPAASATSTSDATPAVTASVDAQATQTFGDDASAPAQTAVSTTTTPETNTAQVSASAPVTTANAAASTAVNSDAQATSAPSPTDASAQAASASTPSNNTEQPKTALGRSIATISEFGAKSLDKINEFGSKIDVDANAAQPDPVKDPFEGFNRKMYTFNSKLDQYILLPIASRYDRYVPQPIHKAITQFFVNLGTPWTAVNNLLQGHPGTSIESLSRFIINTGTSLGFYDTATWLGIENSKQDFGLTLGKWGVGSGPFIMLPFLGPSTVRDALASIPDQFGQPQNYLKDEYVVWGLTGIKAVDMRADLIGLEHIVQGDQYTLIRDLYLQNRQFKINGVNTAANGNDSFGDDGFGDDSSNTPKGTSSSTPPAPSQNAPATPASVDPAKIGTDNLSTPTTTLAAPTAAPVELAAATPTASPAQLITH